MTVLTPSRPRSLLDFQGWTPERLNALLDNADTMNQVLDRPVKKVPALQGLTVCTAFFENSTRTRISFELAARRMSADVVSFAAGASSLSKGESLRDTVEVLTAYKVDAYIVRHPASGAAHLVARYSGKPVINAGDGRRAHPTQALLDAYTIRQEYGSLEGKKVAIIGDIRHSRVARSNAELLPKLGAEVVLSGPATLLPADLAAMPGVTVTTDPQEAVRGANAVMALRLQQERMNGGYLASFQEYAERYQVNEALLQEAESGAIVLHPGPMNRDLEISSEVADGPRSRILKQVENGQAVRMSVLYHLLVGRD
ncbi:aspartate carbamoyltransferase catalytic subunit [Deinococcus metallilatus]|uniref:Aspartate carbamoyltransferase n=1 Tax=Deinococcus metallilatus TaxID=1211322 RepID=A0AAJ5F5H0_9DEIO|nr:aspartate carbamoyltransferase catalytic subunit [Deinococcus metallilatus]MBB5294829.1 aspartate carbamoyltransferase catalytic subunit [Deinococcus metallilatus]QBY09454.1 aspartate carbamoyltransferase catalytic subunit [Deinococcus metallilatus]RXJ09459.1 aspartate carbamoyltransferase catalytic subunit [Deinococcus metallilatus]TLK28982.1 aspartate carbamoyltransferase catalytic subunit [Deinococcus metallilatus]GMA16756.1 aspartate carbamoyltransferase [Deinococcus metallilatus]